jgi:CxxC motif-containing protein
MSKPITCIVCPKGCQVTVTVENGVFSTLGNACLRGKDYAIQETTEPKRMLTGTVKIIGASVARCPVVTSAPIRKEDQFKVMSLLEKVEVNAPVLMNQIVLHDVLNSGVDVLITRSMVKQQ